MLAKFAHRPETIKKIKTMNINGESVQLPVNSEIPENEEIRSAILETTNRTAATEY